MNRTILLLFCAFLFSGSLTAQATDTAQTKALYHHIPGRFWHAAAKHVKMNGWNDITIGTGYMSGRQFLYALGADIGPEVTSGLPTFFISYRYFLFKRIALGFTLGTQTLWGNSNYENTGQQYTFKDVSSTFAIELTTVYAKRDNIMFYGHYGIGISDIEIQYSAPYSPAEYKTLANVQLTPMGIRFGRNLAGFIEFGIGYKGLVNAGLSYNFASDKTTARKKEH